MNICMVLENYFPPDIRVEKEARSLLGAGHKIFLLSLGKEGMRPVEDVKGITVIRILPPQNPIKRVLGTFSFSILFESNFWRKNLEKVIKKYKIDIIHCHDLHLVKTSIYCAKKYDIPIIADLHENFPEGIKAWRKEKTSIKFRAYNRLHFPFPMGFYKRFERSILKKVDHIVTVVDEAKRHYIDDCEIPLDKVTVVMNTEDLEEFEKIKIQESFFTKFKNNYVITFLGNLSPHRGLETVIKSMPKIIEIMPEAKLLLVGGKGQERYEKQLKTMCVDLKVEHSVVFIGWVNFSLVPSYVVLSDVCLVPHNASGHTHTTIPHKLFQYMIMRKPVIVTDCRPLKRIVEECDCGIVVPSHGYNEMTKAVIRLYENKDYAEQLGENGRKAVVDKYNWKRDGKKLVEVYKRFTI
ncbi:MAG: glycosyltransferase family 4 protein [Methanomassiliicoccales archaeon]|nr:MAG: glycosyltransferase family 4 protein [Methanomassiliicoccales archaeon]